MESSKSPMSFAGAGLPDGKSSSIRIRNDSDSQHRIGRSLNGDLEWNCWGGRDIEQEKRNVDRQSRRTLEKQSMSATPTN